MRRIERRAPVPGGLRCAFTGHRPGKYAYLSNERSPEYIRLKLRVLDEIQALTREGFTHFMSGGARGVDTLAAKCVLETISNDPGVTLEMVLPCPEQAAKWPRRDRDEYAYILDKADVLTMVSPFYTPFCMSERNKRMVEMCDALIAVYDGTPGGTRNTLAMALELNKRVIVIDPNKL